MDTSEIDLSKLSISEACMWLLASLNVDKFSEYAYTIPFSSYVMTWPRAVPLNTILILQSPYPNNIFPPTAAAMSYDSELCKKEMKGKELPPTVQVLANDLYINAGMEKEDTISILKNGWALIDRGILMFNEAVFHLYDKEEAYLESVKQCSVIIRLLQETERHGKRTVNIFAFGESGERVGSNLCSWYKSPLVTLTKRKVTHPAGIARRHYDLDSPECHMGTASFSRALASVFSNHVAFMHIMGKKSEQDLRSERLQNTFNQLREHFPSLEESLTEFFTLQKEFANMIDDKRYKEILDKLEQAGDILGGRLRIAASIVNTGQSYGSSVAANVSKSAPSMKLDNPSQSLLSEHIGRESSPTNPIPDAKFKIKDKVSKNRAVSTPVKTESFVSVSSPPSIASVMSDAPTPSSSGKIKIKEKLPRKNTPLKQSTTKEPVKEEIKEDTEQDDIVSPLTKKFAKKAIVPKSKGKVSTVKDTSDDVFIDVKLSDRHIKTLSSIQAIVELHKPDIDQDEFINDDFENINNDIKSKMADNTITQTLVQAINKDIESNPDFDINKWLSPNSATCATFEVCKKEFKF